MQQTYSSTTKFLQDQRVFSMDQVRQKISQATISEYPYMEQIRNKLKNLDGSVKVTISSLKSKDNDKVIFADGKYKGQQVHIGGTPVSLHLDDRLKLFHDFKEASIAESVSRKTITEVKIRQVIREEINEVLGLGKFFDRFKKPSESDLPSIEPDPESDEMEVVDVEDQENRASELQNYFITKIKQIAIKSPIIARRLIEYMYSNLNVSWKTSGPRSTVMFMQAMKDFKTYSSDQEVTEIKQKMSELESLRPEFKNATLRTIVQEYEDDSEIPKINESKKKLKR